MMETENQVAQVKREKLLEIMTCPICRKLFKDATTISECLHTFCRKCIYDKITEEDLNTCPVCRTSFGCSPLDKLRADNNWRDLRLKIFPPNKVTSKPDVPPLKSLPAKGKEKSLSSMGVSATKEESRKLPLAGRRSKLTSKRITAQGESTDIAEPVKEVEDCPKNVNSLETDTKNAENTMQIHIDNESSKQKKGNSASLDVQNHTAMGPPKPGTRNRRRKIDSKAMTKISAVQNSTASEPSTLLNGAAGESSKQDSPDQCAENNIAASLDVKSDTVMGPPKPYMRNRRHGENDSEEMTRISAVQNHTAAEPSKLLNGTTGESSKQDCLDQCAENNIAASLDVKNHTVMGPPKPRMRTGRGENDSEIMTWISAVQNHTAADSSKQEIPDQYTESHAAPLDVQNHLVMGPPKPCMGNIRRKNPPEAITRIFSAPNPKYAESSKQLNRNAAASCMQKNSTIGESSKPDQNTKNQAARLDEQKEMFMGTPMPSRENNSEAMTPIFFVQNQTVTQSSKKKIPDQHTENHVVPLEVQNQPIMRPPYPWMLDSWFRENNPDAKTVRIAHLWNTSNNLVGSASTEVAYKSSEEKTVKSTPFTLFGQQVHFSTVQESFKEPKVLDNRNYSIPPTLKQSGHDPKVPSNYNDSKSKPSTSKGPAFTADLNLPAPPSFEEERVNVDARSIPIWFTLVASVDQVGNKPLPQISSRYLRVKERNLTVSYIKKYIVRKLGLFSEDEVEISLRGQPLLPSVQLDYLVDWWVNTTPLSERIESTVGSSAQDFVMVITYSRKAPSPIVISD